MKRIEFSLEKNKKLKDERGYCFDDILYLLNNNKYEIKNNKSSNHSDQRIFVLELDGYSVVVPFVEDEEKYFLKTMYKSRKIKKEVKNGK